MDSYVAPPSSVGSVALGAHNESAQSSISWSAVIAGAVVSAALALILLVLCVGLKLTTVSPWVHNASATTLGMVTIVAAILIQLIASAVGGYIAGRLRTKWVEVHDDEVYFRDTAHGFIVWALATVASAAFLTTAASSAIGAAAGPMAMNAAPAVAAAAPTGAAAAPPADAASATTPPAITTPPATTTAAATTADTSASTPPTATPAPAAPAAIATAAGLTPEAQANARSAAAQTALWTFVALLVGAFSASLAATLGGRQRDGLTAHSTHRDLRT